jgi:hypothetical protein
MCIGARTELGPHPGGVQCTLCSYRSKSEPAHCTPLGAAATLLWFSTHSTPDGVGRKRRATSKSYAQANARATSDDITKS